MSPQAAAPIRNRPGVRAWVQLTVTEAKLVARDTGGLIIPVGLPLLILVMNGLGADREGVAELGGLSPFDAIIMPVVLVMVVAVIGLINMPSFLAFYRTTGVLRRLAVTPAHPLMILAAQVVVSIVQTVVGVALALTVAWVAFDVAAPASVAVALGAGALIAASLYAVGMLIAAVSPTTNAAIAIGLVAFLGMLALGGGFGPTEGLPEWLARTGEHLPFGAGVATLSAAWIGEAPDGGHLVALAAAGIAATGLAAWLFRWE